MLDGFSSLGLQIVYVAITLAIVLIPAFLVDKIGDRIGKKRDMERGQEGGIGCAAQAALFVALLIATAFLLGPARLAIGEAQCRLADSFTDCMSGGDGGGEYDRR